MSIPDTIQQDCTAIFIPGDLAGTQTKVQEYCKKGGDLHTISQYLQNFQLTNTNAPIIELFYWYHTVIHVAKDQGESPEIEKIQNIFQSIVQSQSERSPLLLYLALHHNFYPLARQLIDYGYDVNASLPGTQATALHYAVDCENLFAVKWLIDNRALPNKKSMPNEESPIHHACKRGNVEILAFLLNSGAELEDVSKPGHLPIHYAASQSNKKALQFLIKKGARLNGVNLDGETALHKACLERQLPNIRHFLNKGIDIFVVDRFKMLALDTYFTVDSTHHAEMKGAESPDYEPYVEIEKLLVLFKQINFTDPQKPGWVDPRAIIDTDIQTSDGKPYVVPVKELEARLNIFVNRIKDKVAFRLTPPKEDIMGLEKWYRKLKSLLKPVVDHCLEEDKRAQRHPGSNPTPYARTLIEFALIAKLCGTSYMNEAELQNSLLKMNPLNGQLPAPRNVKDYILEICEELKKSVTSSLVDKKYVNNVHMVSGFLQWIDEAAGVPKQKMAERLYSLDIEQKRLLEGLDRKDYLDKFNNLYTPTSLLAKLDDALNGQNAKIDRDLLIDFFKHNIEPNWKKEKYDQIQREVGSCESIEEKVRKLQSFDILVNPVLVKRGGVDWDKLIEENRQYEYIAHKVIDQNTGKIKRSALLDLLLMLKIIKPKSLS